MMRKKGEGENEDMEGNRNQKPSGLLAILLALLGFGIIYVLLEKLLSSAKSFISSANPLLIATIVTALLAFVIWYMFHPEKEKYIVQIVNTK